MERRYRITPAGEAYKPEVDHNIVAWGAIKELFRLHGGSASRREILKVLEWCGQPDPSLNPNRGYLDYAVRNGWLIELANS